MARVPNVTRAAIVAAVWFAGLFLAGPLSDNVDVQGGYLAAWTLAAGAVAATWWILAAPWAAVAATLAIDALNPCHDCRDELGFVGSLFLMSIAALLAAAILAIGVGLRIRIAPLPEHDPPPPQRPA